MALKIPRLQPNQELVDESRLPTTTFMRWWQSVAESIENAINNIRDILVRLGLVEETADGALTLSESAINPDGTIKDSKVLTQSIVIDAVTNVFYVQNAAPINLPNGVATTIVSTSITKARDESAIKINCTLRLNSSDDIIGLFQLFRDGNVVDSAEYDCRTNGSVYKALLPFTSFEEGVTAGTYAYDLKFTRNGGASSVQASIGCNMDLTEVKR